MTINFLKKCSRSYSEIKNELFKNLFKLLGISSSFYAIFELFLCNFLCNTTLDAPGMNRLLSNFFYNLNMFLSESLDSGGKFCAFLHSKSIKTCNLQNLCFISWQTIFWLPNLQNAQNQNSAVKIDQKYPFRQKVH